MRTVYACLPRRSRVELLLSILLAAGIALVLLAPGPGHARNFGSTARHLFTITEGDYLSPLLSPAKMVTYLNCAVPGIARFAGYDDFSTRVDIGEQVHVAQITRYNGNLLALLGIQFELVEPSAGNERFVYISESFWERAFARRGDILGTVVTMHNTMYRIRGVTRATSGRAASSEVWLPVTGRGGHGGTASMRIIGVLQPEMDWANAEKKLAACFHDFLEDLPYSAMTGAKLVPLEKTVCFGERGPLLAEAPGVGRRVWSKS